MRLGGGRRPAVVVVVVVNGYRFASTVRSIAAVVEALRV